MFLILLHKQCSMDLPLDSWPYNSVNFLFSTFISKKESLELWSLCFLKGAGERTYSPILCIQLCRNCWCSGHFTHFAYSIADIFGMSVTQSDKNTNLYCSFCFCYMKSWLLLFPTLDFQESTPRSIRLDKLLICNKLVLLSLCSFSWFQDHSCW